LASSDSQLQMLILFLKRFNLTNTLAYTSMYRFQQTLLWWNFEIQTFCDFS